MARRQLFALAAGAGSLALSGLLPGSAAGDQNLPESGKVDVKMVPVSGSGPKVVARAVLDVPPRKVWQIVSDCAHYKEHMPHVAASELVKKVGNVHTCKVTIAMPFPFSNLTAVTDAVHEESEQGMSRRWKLVRGDYTYNEGSWEVFPADKAGKKSLVVYTVHAEPKTSVPAWIRESAQKKALPEMVERVGVEAAKLP